jgi:RNA polymerase sigma-70 factor (ECF subfamily)
VALPPNGTLDQIYREHRQQLFTCALAVTRCADRAEDAIQEAFCRLYRLDVRPQNVKAYVFRAVRNAALDQLRGNPIPIEAFPEFIFDPRPGPSEAAVGQEFQRRVAAALLGLSADERETIVQHLYASLTFRDIAEIREAPLGTVTSWYQRGLAKLRTELGE